MSFRFVILGFLLGIVFSFGTQHPGVCGELDDDSSAVISTEVVRGLGLTSWEYTITGGKYHSLWIEVCESDITNRLSFSFSSRISCYLSPSPSSDSGMGVFCPRVSQGSKLTISLQGEEDRSNSFTKAVLSDSTPLTLLVQGPGCSVRNFSTNELLDLEWNFDPLAFAVSSNGEMSVTPSILTDYWQNTFYVPPINKANGPGLLKSLSLEKDCECVTSMTISPLFQFDQGGVLLYSDENNWVKAGIEFVDGSPRASVVVTRDAYSDWSSQIWGSNVTEVRIHIYRQTKSLTVDVRKSSDDPWQEIRVAPWPLQPGGDSCGIYTSRPGEEESTNGITPLAVFSYLVVNQTETV